MSHEAGARLSTITDTEPRSLPDSVLNQHDDKYFNDSHRADRLVKQFGMNLRYCIERRTFYIWDGRRWIYDDGREVGKLAESSMDTVQFEALKIPDIRRREEFLEKISNAKNNRQIKDVIERAKGKVIGVSINEFDVNPWYLNCTNGVVDLRSGELLQHTREMMCTKMIPFDYDPSARCPLFMRFLERIMGGGETASADQQETSSQLIDCLQKVFGCSATGRFEKLLVILYGSVGDNGKTTLLEIIRKALGNNPYSKEYTGELKVSTITARSAGSNNAGSDDIADLKGCRFVTIAEPEEGIHLSVSLMKYITGGGQMKARHLHEKHITFMPVHTLFFDGNHFPVINNSRDPVWNRIRGIPFLVTIPKDQQDTSLPDKLEAELPGILSWIVRGAIWYAEFGLEFPPAVTALTEEYRVKSDHFMAFVEDCCIRGEDVFVPVAKLKQAYEMWIASNGEDKLSMLSSAAFNDRVQQLGCKKGKPTVKEPGQLKGHQVRSWMGIRLRPEIRRAISLNPADAMSPTG